MSCDLSYRYWNPHKVEKLTTWWADCSHAISCHSSKNWPQRNGNKPALELKINCTQNSQDDADQTTTWLISRRLAELTVPFLHTALSLSCIKLLPTDMQWGGGEGGSLWTRVHPPPVASIQSKANFPFHQSHLSIGFWEVSCWTPQGDRPQRKPTLVGPCCWTSRL